MSYNNTLAYNKEIIYSRKAVAAIGVAFFVLATALGAYVRVPVPGSPVPITLQTFFVLLAGAVLGRRLGVVSQVGYILIGAAGLPVFQGAGFGISCLVGPTAGYLVGFIAAAYTIGSMTGSGKCGVVKSFIAFFIGSAIIYLFGSAWLVLAYKMAPVNAFSLGVLPFIPGDIAKVSIAAAIYSRISDRAGNIFSA